MATIKKIRESLYHFWVDFLELYATFFDEKNYFDTLDFDNSNTWELDGYQYIKTEVPRYTYKIMFLYQNNAVFAYYKWETSGTIPSKDLFLIYGMGFKLLSKEQIQDFMSLYLIDIQHIRRLDICLDVTLSMIEVLKIFPKYKGKWVIYDDENWEPETRYFWQIRKHKNKRHIVRVYDKLRDIQESKKIRSHAEYFRHDDVTRIELEIRSELAKNFSIYDLWDEEILKAVYVNYLSNYTKSFSFLSDNPLTLYRKKEAPIDVEEYQSLYYRTQRANIFLWHARTAYRLWFCPVRILIAEWLIQPKTESILWWDLIQHMAYMERQLFRTHFREKARQRSLKHLLDNSPEYEDSGE